MRDWRTGEHVLVACLLSVAMAFVEKRRRRERSKSAERRRARNLAAIEKRAAELRDSRKGIEAAEHRQEVGGCVLDWIVICAQTCLVCRMYSA